MLALLREASQHRKHPERNRRTDCIAVTSPLGLGESSLQMERTAVPSREKKFLHGNFQRHPTPPCCSRVQSKVSRHELAKYPLQPAILMLAALAATVELAVNAARLGSSARRFPLRLQLWPCRGSCTVVPVARPPIVRGHLVVWRVEIGLIVPRLRYSRLIENCII